jgi:hypothetical protein
MEFKYIAIEGKPNHFLVRINQGKPMVFAVKESEAELEAMVEEYLNPTPAPEPEPSDDELATRLMLKEYKTKLKKLSKQEKAELKNK